MSTNGTRLVAGLIAGAVALSWLLSSVPPQAARTDAARSAAREDSAPAPVSTDELKKKDDQADRDLAVRIVTAAIQGNRLGVTPNQLMAASNPRGAGIFIYVPETRFHGVERLLAWMVLDGIAYPINGATIGLNETLPRPNSASISIWGQTGFESNDVRGMLNVVFPNR